MNGILIYIERTEFCKGENLKMYFTFPICLKVFKMFLRCSKFPKIMLKMQKKILLISQSLKKVLGMFPLPFEPLMKTYVFHTLFL